MLKFRGYSRPTSGLDVLGIAEGQYGTFFVDEKHPPPVLRPEAIAANLKSFGRATFNLGNEAGDRAKSLSL